LFENIITKLVNIWQEKERSAGWKPMASSGQLALALVPVRYAHCMAFGHKRKASFRWL